MKEYDFPYGNLELAACDNHVRKVNIVLTGIIIIIMIVLVIVKINVDIENNYSSNTL